MLVAGLLSIITSDSGEYNSKNTCSSYARTGTSHTGRTRFF
jgi:hypothetical protein